AAQPGPRQLSSLHPGDAFRDCSARRRPCLYLDRNGPRSCRALMPLAAFTGLARHVLWGAWRQNRGRLALTAVAIALGIALAAAVHLINYSAASEFTAAVRSLTGTADLVVRGPRSGFDERTYPQLARRPDVAEASPVVEVDAKLIEPEGTLRIVGLDLLRALALQPGLLGEAQEHLVDLFVPNTV